MSGGARYYLKGYKTIQFSLGDNLCHGISATSSNYTFFGFYRRARTIQPKYICEKNWICEEGRAKKMKRMSNR